MKSARDKGHMRGDAHVPIKLYKDRWQARSGLQTSASQCFKRITDLGNCFLLNREVLGLEKKISHLQDDGNSSQDVQLLLATIRREASVKSV